MIYSQEKNNYDRIAVVIPYFSGVDHLCRSVDSILNSTYINADVVIVDHSGNEELLSHIDVSNLRIARLKASDSLWWSGATNVGVNYALDRDYPYIMLLNHDCFVRPDTINLLFQSCKNRDDCIIAPIQHNLRTGHKVVRATSCFLLGFSTLILPNWRLPFSKKQKLVPTSLIIGGRGVIISSNVFKVVGSFDEQRFPHYGGDHDFYFRARNNGYRLFVNSSAFVDVNDEKTTTAISSNGNTLRSLYAALFDRSSHRNITDQYSLFSKYYPIPYLAFLGIALNLTRFMLVTIVRNLIHTLRGKSGEKLSGGESQ